MPPGGGNAFAERRCAESRDDTGHGLWRAARWSAARSAEQVANRILAMIKSGNLKSGDRLPTEQQMGIAFGISRPPLREALKALTLMGVLESRQGGRYTVTDLSPSRLVAPFNVMLVVSRTTTCISSSRHGPLSTWNWSGSAPSAPRRAAPAHPEAGCRWSRLSGRPGGFSPARYRVSSGHQRPALATALLGGTRAGSLRPRPRCPAPRERNAGRHRQERWPAHRGRRGDQDRRRARRQWLPIAAISNTSATPPFNP